jgi:NADH-quinone oxidoreductase subunit M
MSNVVLLLLVVPIAGAIAAALLGAARAAAVRWASLAATLTALVLAMIIAGSFVQLRLGETSQENSDVTFHPEFVPGAPGVLLATSGASDMADVHGTSWELVRFGSGPAATAVRFYLGIDGLNVWLIVLTALLMVCSVLVSWTAIRERENEFYAWLLALETGLLGVFMSFDIVLFYLFFELTLVPLFFVIGIWGGPQRRYAARKFFIYTLTGSLFTLLGVLTAVLACYFRADELTFSLPRLVQLVHQRMLIDSVDERAFWHTVQFWVFLAMAAGFAVKVPLVPLHTWLPLAHVEAPTAGSVILAGVLLKIGSYGFLRLCLPLAPDASVTLGVPLIGTLAVIGIVYGALCALAQNDIKRLVAYSSVSHLGFCMLGMFALDQAGLSGSLMQMINHGLSTGALFLLVGMLYERYHTRLMKDYGGIGARLGLLACFMVFFCLTSAGLPGLNGFVGEVLILMGAFNLQISKGQWPTLAVVGSTGIVLGAWYLFTMLRQVFFGPVKEPEVAGPEHQHAPVRDLHLRELAALIPIGVVCIWLGVYPQPFFDTVRRDIDVVARAVDVAKQSPSLAVRHSVPVSQPKEKLP